MLGARLGGARVERGQEDSQEGKWLVRLEGKRVRKVLAITQGVLKVLARTKWTRLVWVEP